ncbi:hypothetical protein Zmor_019096 [Zophobas morio]|uniref:Uncharacterized protein n=1 Tax=Zophobas morio TaxID=2755281 RepID=A0AA38HP08_9CUCU|nr:hypothetical protein Zmor_019096 [Zophobas morio]
MRLGPFFRPIRTELCSGTCSPKKCLYCLIIARSLPGSHDPMAWLLRLYKSAQLEAAAQKFRVEVLKQEVSFFTKTSLVLFLNGASLKSQFQNCVRS